MLEILNPYKIAAVVALVFGIFFFGAFVGYSHEYKVYTLYKEQIEKQAKEQEVKTNSIINQSQSINEGIKNEYEAKLAAIRNYYSGMHYTSPSSLPTFPNSTSGVNENSPNYQLIEACSETTVQLTTLQEWVINQGKIR